MTQKYILAIDGGSQSSKVTIFDLVGNPICEGKVALSAMDTPRPGVVEHPEDDLYDSVVSACKIALSRFEGDINDIIGIGLCSIRYCRCYMKADGTLAYPVLSWMDTRVSKPFEKINEDVRYVATTNGYLMGRFTGELNDTVANCHGLWPIDADNWKWTDDEALYESTQMPRDMLYDLKMPGEIGGYLTAEMSEILGLPGGIPVVHTANDKAVEALGTGLQDSETALVSLGTYIAGMTIGDKNISGTEHYWANFASQPHKYLYECYGIRRGMWTISWVKDLLGEEVTSKAHAQGISEEEVLNDMAAKISPGSDGLMCVLDWLAPTDALYKKGMFIGFDIRHTYAHMYRSVIEAIAMTMKNNVDLMANELKTDFKRVIVSGGGSNSELVMQIFADVFGIPASRNVVNSAASMGSAICTAVALGVYKDFDEAIEKMVRQRDVFEPNQEAHEVYVKFCEIYKDIRNYTDPLLQRTYELFK